MAPVSINGTTGISGVDGSAGTPALQGSDANTGIAFSSDVILGSTGGTERFRCDSSGRLLVGTSTSPSAGSGQYAPLVVQGYIGSPTGDGGIALQRGEGAATITSGEEIGGIYFNDNAGNTFANIKAIADANAGTNDYPGRLSFSTTADGASSPTERMRIRNNGQILIDRTSSTVGGKLEVYADSDGTFEPMAVIQGAAAGSPARASIIFYRTSAGATVGSITTTNSATAYNTSSDYRLKENVTAVTDGIVRLQQLKPSRFNFIANPDHTVDGFIAHEVQDVVPEAIHGEKDAVDADGNPIYQGIDQSKLVPLLTAALQEAIAKIESLETRLAALEVTP